MLQHCMYSIQNFETDRLYTIIWACHSAHLKFYYFINDDFLKVPKRYEKLLRVSSSVDIGCLGVTYSPGDTRFAGSNPAEVYGFFQAVKILSTNPPGRTLSWGPESEISSSLKNLKPKHNRHLS